MAEDDATDAMGESMPPTEAFSILSHETRLSVLRVLGEATSDVLSFAELRKRVAPDDTGNFNYHLSKLTGHFLRQTDAGYELRYAGEQVVRAIRAGTMTEDPTLQIQQIDERCPFCGMGVEMGYDEERITVRCLNCGGVIAAEYGHGTIMHYGFPPAGLADRQREAVVDAAHVLYDAKVTPMLRNVCPECAGVVEISFDVCDSHERGEDGLCSDCETRYEVWALLECSNCGYARTTAMWFAATNHPAVVAFLHEEGLTESVPFRKLTWDNAELIRGVQGSVQGTDPYEFRVTIPGASEAIVVEIDAELTVQGVRRIDSTPTEDQAATGSEEMS